MKVGISLTSHHDVADLREGARWMIERAQAARRAGLDSLFLGGGAPLFELSDGVRRRETRAELMPQTACRTVSALASWLRPSARTAMSVRPSAAC